VQHSQNQTPKVICKLSHRHHHRAHSLLTESARVQTEIARIHSVREEQPAI